MQLRSPEGTKSSRKMENVPLKRRRLYPTPCAAGTSASPFSGVEGSKSAGEMDGGWQNVDQQPTNDYFKEYREALQAVLPPEYTFRVRKVESTPEHVCGEQLACGKVLIGRRRDKEASVWAFLEGQNGERVMYRDSDKETVLIPLQLDDFVEFEPVFQLISDPMDLRKFASATETTRRKRWVSRIALVARLVLRDYAFYSPTIRVSDSRLKKEVVVQIIRRNLAAKKPYIGHEPNRNSLKPSVESPRSLIQNEEAALVHAGFFFAEQSTASEPTSCPAAIGDENQSDARDLSSLSTLEGAFVPSMPDRIVRQYESAASPVTDSVRRSRSTSTQGTELPPSPVRKRARLVSDTASDAAVCYDEDLHRGSMCDQSQAATSLQQTSQSPRGAEVRPLTLKGFAERKVEEARRQERDKAAQQIASVDCEVQDLKKTLGSQQEALEEQGKRHQELQERSAAAIYSRDQRIDKLESEVRMLRRLKRGFDEFDRSWVVEMLKDQAWNELGSEAEAGGDAVEAYIKHAFERNYGIPLYEGADSEASQETD